MSKKRDATKAKIKNAFIDLLEHRDPLSISVTDICLKSQINRSTFYQYYSYIDLLIKDVIYDQINTTKDNEVLYDEYYTDNNTGPDRVARYMLNIASNNVLMKLIKCGEGNRFKTEITNVQCDYEIKRFNINDQKKKTQVLFRNSGVFAIIFDWIEKHNTSNLNEIAAMLYNEIRKTEQRR